MRKAVQEELYKFLTINLQVPYKYLKLDSCNWTSNCSNGQKKRTVGE